MGDHVLGKVTMCGSQSLREGPIFNDVSVLHACECVKRTPVCVMCNWLCPGRTAAFNYGLDWSCLLCCSFYCAVDFVDSCCLS